MTKIGRERGWPPMSREQFEASRSLRGANFVGSPEQVVEKILFQHEIFGHDRFLLQLTVGSLDHAGRCARSSSTAPRSPLPCEPRSRTRAKPEPPTVSSPSSSRRPPRRYTRAMREHDLELLELPAVLARLAGAADSEPGAALAEALRPAARRDRGSPSATADERGDRAPRRGSRTRPRWTRRRPRSSRARGTRQHARPRALAQIERTIRAGVTARREFAERGDLPALIDLAGGIEPSLLSVAEEIGRAVEEDGSDLRDSASPSLRRLRRELREGRGRLAERLRKIARDPPLAEHLQDDFVTERAGRPVLALKASARGRVPGIVHDSSGSGQTLFVEPLAAVDDSNRLREAEVAERDEVVRILRNLSSLTGAHAEELEVLVDAAARARPHLRRGQALPRAGRALS